MTMKAKNNLPCAADVTWQECYEYTDDYVLNIGQDPDDYDMLTASKTLCAYVYAHADKLDAQAHAIGWLPLEVVAPEVIGGIMESCKLAESGNNDTPTLR